MVSARNIQDKKRDILKGLSESDLNQYIRVLTDNYYKAFADNKENEFDYNLMLINEVIDIFEDTYINIVGIIYFNLFLSANQLLLNNGSESNVKLIAPFKYKLSESNEVTEELNHDIKAIFNKERIKERYNEKKVNQIT